MKKVNRITIKWHGLFEKIDGLQTNTQNRIHIEREIVPIIFVPGIMGSRLRRRMDKVKIWDPDDKNFMVGKFGWKTVTAAERRALLIGGDFSPTYAEVDNHDVKHNKKFASRHDQNRDKRGWGGVMWGSYGDFLVKLQQYQWPYPLNACFEFPVHAFGYNWTASSDDSGLHLRSYIEQTISNYRNGAYGHDRRKRDCDKVILVTHSMGGLVARSACVLHDAADNVIGVVHGVQPATGSPAAYWRMKAGFERPRGGPRKEWWDWLRNPLKMSKHHLVGRVSAVILGTDGEEVTSLLGNSPGGLELLPTREYRDNAGNIAWLEYPTAKGTIRLPVADPYKELYELKDVGYRMVNPQWLNPADLRRNVEHDRPVPENPWGKFHSCLTQAKHFHARLGSACHPRTYQFYGKDLSSADRIVFTREVLTPRLDSGDCHPNLHFKNKGAFKMWINRWESEVVGRDQAVAVVALQDPSGDGDGTVPVSSANFLKLPEGRSTKIGVDEEAWFGIGHQDILGTSSAQTLVVSGIQDCMCKYFESSLHRTNKH